METTILHELEELGQSRPEQFSELAVVVGRTALRALGTAIIWGTVITGGRWLFGDSVSWWSALVTYGAAFVIRFGLSIETDIDQHVEGLRASKTAVTYAPPPPEPEPVAVPASSIVVRPYGGEPYVLDPNKQIPALPDGRNMQLGLNPETLSVVLREVLNEHGGQWSRSRLMSIRVNGQRITRTLYEQMTDALCRAGFLQERTTGGYAIPPNIQRFDDLRTYFPRLPGLPAPSQDGGREGRQAGGRERGASQPSQAANREEIPLAERRRQRWLECGCDIKLYRGNHHGA